MSLKRASLAVLLLVSTSSIFAADYMVQASRWSKAQTAAVEAAGGTVTFSHARTGIAAVSSDSPNFAANAMKSGALQSVDQDVVLQWVEPGTTVEFEESATVVDPSNDRFAPLQWSLSAVNAPAAWAKELTGRGVRVAILDGGLYNAHPDLAANVDTAASKSFAPGLYNSDTGTFWHGTHVAGIVAARDNNIGVVGIAPEATLIGVKVLHNGSGAFSWIIRGILYASDPIIEGGAGADIINMSLGADFPRTGNGQLLGAMAKTLNYAASRGVLAVSSAGNDGYDLGQLRNVTTVPAESGSGVAVSATGPLGWAKYGTTNFRRPASYSNYGEGTVFVAGPGGDFAYPGNEGCTMATNGGAALTRPCWVFDLVMSTSRGTTVNGGYSWAAGTSMAAPAVSAVAALIKQAHPNASLGELKTRLARATSDEGRNGHDEFYGHGFVDASKID